MFRRFNYPSDDDLQEFPLPTWCTPAATRKTKTDTCLVAPIYVIT